MAVHQRLDGRALEQASGSHLEARYLARIAASPDGDLVQAQQFRDLFDRERLPELAPYVQYLKPNVLQELSESCDIEQP